MEKNRVQNKKDEAAEELRAQQEYLMEMGGVFSTRGKHAIHCLTVIGLIEGHVSAGQEQKVTRYEHVIPQLVAIEEDPEIEGLLVILNTVGGDVESGLAIAEMIASLSKPVVSLVLGGLCLAELIAGVSKPSATLVLGGGHSIGIPLAVSAQRSFIVPSATMTVHPVRHSGLVLGVPQTLSYFDRMQERIVRFVTDNSKISSKDFRRLMMNTGELVMDVGTVLDGEKAVEEGLIDHLGGLSEAIACLYEMIESGDGGKKAAKKAAKGRRTAKAKGGKQK